MYAWKYKKSFRIILIIYAQFLTKNVQILQNVPIPSNCKLPTHSSTKCFNTSILYTTDTHFYNSSVNIGSISFFSSSDTHQSHHLLGCHATGVNPSFIFFKCLAFFKFNMLDKKAVLIRLKIKTSCYTKKLF